jgi:hypothetical protein
MRQGYNLVFCASMAGRIIPPLIGIRASKRCTVVEVGKPILIRVTDPEYMSLFDSEGVSPLIVIYANGDKRVCSTLWNEGILDPWCNKRKEKLGSDGGQR